ncbi:MAG: multicopper oxidase domain-containing protein, partial [Acidobacteria bacterium]|nr:multicopper oxidase domain-containing protein [Acidobacteriota bacterium]
MIDRRQFMHTAAAAAVGITWGCADGAAEPSRRRAVRRGAEILRSAGGRLEASLEAAESIVDLGGREGRLFAFNGLVPGPRFELEAGDEVTLMLDNALGEATNLHFHGLHVPPTGAADN